MCEDAKQQQQAQQQAQAERWAEMRERANVDQRLTSSLAAAQAAVRALPGEPYLYTFTASDPFVPQGAFKITVEGREFGYIRHCIYQRQTGWFGRLKWVWVDSEADHETAVKTMRKHFDNSKSIGREQHYLFVV